MPSIIFLGTGGDEFVVGKQIKASGGIIVQVEGYQFHIDPGPGAIVRAHQAGVNLRENTAVLVSHAHINHCNDVNAVISAMSHNGFDINGVLISNITFANGSKESKMYPLLTEFHRNCVERVIVAKPNQRIGIETVEIQTLKAFHKDPNAMGFKLITPQFTLTYSGDTKYNKELLEEYKKSDILILNLVHPSGTSSKNTDNLNFEDAVRILDKTKPKLAVITHFGKAMIKADPLNEARELQKLTGVQVLAAIDGMSINPVSYSADAKQKTLNIYKESANSKSSNAQEEKEDETEKEEHIEEQVTLVDVSADPDDDALEEEPDILVEPDTIIKKDVLEEEPEFPIKEEE